MAKEKKLKIEDWAGCDAQVGELRRVDSRVAKMLAKREAAKAKIDEQYREALDGEGELRKVTVASVRAFCKKHRRDLHGAKSVQLDNGVVGWELGKQRVDLLTRAKDWAKALLKIVADGRKRYVRIIRELAKSVMIEDYKAGTLTDEQLAAWDLRITQTERFFIRPKADDGRDRNAEA